MIYAKTPLSYGRGVVRFLCFVLGFQRLEDHVRAHIDVAAAEGDDEVVLLRVLDDVFGDVLKGVDTHAALDLCAEIGIVDVVGVGLADRQDLRDDRHIGDTQRLGEVIEQESGTGEGVRLEYRPDLSKAHFHRGAQGRGQLCGMMREVVGYGDAARRAEYLKASVNACKFAEILRDLLSGRAEVMRGGSRGEGVVDIVSAGHHQIDLTQLFALVHEVKGLVRALDISEVRGIVIVGLSETEGDRRDGHVLDHVEDILIVAVVDDQARGQVTELVEALFDVVERFEIIQMIRVNVGDDGDERIQLEEGVDIFARLADDDVAVTDVAVAAEEGQLAADDRGRVKARADQKLAEHGGGRGLAVSARDRDRAVVSAGDDTQHDRSLDGGDILLLSRDKLGIVFFDSGGVDDQLRALDVLRLVSHEYGDAVAADTVERFAFVSVGACQLIALAVQDLRQWAHARAADADKVDAFDII